EGKVEEARRLGADEVIITRNSDDVASHAGSFDLIVNTVSAAQDLQSFLVLLRRDGTLVLVGAGSERHTSPDAFALLANRRSIAGSMIGGIAETQEMLDFCADNNITADIEQIGVSDVDTAYDRIVASD